MADIKTNGRGLLGGNDVNNAVDNTVVVVEDDPMVSQVVCSILSAAGLAARPAGNGLEALELLRRVRPRVALIDVFLPHMSGYEICEANRATPGTDDLYIIMMSGLPVETGNGSPKWNRVIGKPIDPELLIDMVRRAPGIAAAQPDPLAGR